VGDVVQQEKKPTTPQQLEEDHITLMTMRHLKLFTQNQTKVFFLLNV
jgi:hypothetical protein